MGRRKYTDKRVREVLSIPESVLCKVELLLFDPMKGKVQHGAKSALVTQLLREWVAKQTGGNHGNKADQATREHDRDSDLAEEQ